MTVSAGDDGMKNATRVVRRPTIRPRAVTPARTAWTLPPPRVPVARAPRRPVLQIVDEEDSGALAAAGVRSQMAGLPPAQVRGAGLWNGRRAVAAIAASVVLVAVAGLVGAQIATMRAIPASTTQTTAAMIVVPTTTKAAPVAAEPVAPAVPVFDVNSLPSAPPRSGNAATH